MIRTHTGLSLVILFTALGTSATGSPIKIATDGSSECALSGTKVVCPHKAKSVTPSCENGRLGCGPVVVIGGGVGGAVENRKPDHAKINKDSLNGKNIKIDQGEMLAAPTTR